MFKRGLHPWTILTSIIVTSEHVPIWWQGLHEQKSVALPRLCQFESRFLRCAFYKEWFDLTLLWSFYKTVSQRVGVVSTGFGGFDCWRSTKLVTLTFIHNFGQTLDSLRCRARMLVWQECTGSNSWWQSFHWRIRCCITYRFPRSALGWFLTFDLGRYHVTASSMYLAEFARTFSSFVLGTLLCFLTHVHLSLFRREFLPRLWKHLGKGES